MTSATTTTTTTTGNNNNNNNNNPSKHPSPPPSSTPSMMMTEKRRDSITSPPPQQQQQQHKFSLPVLKAWGQQRVLRCVKPGGDGPIDSAAPVPPRSTCSHNNPDVVTKSRSNSRDVDRFDKKPRAAPPPPRADDPANMPSVFNHDDRRVDGPAPHADEEEDEEHAASDMPWSLRTRRGSYARPPGGASTTPDDAGELGPGVAGGGARHQKRQRALFSVTLSKVEIEYDVYALTGRRAARRPRKRPRALKRQLDMLFPGYYLSEAAAEAYEVVEPLPLPEA